MYLRPTKLADDDGAPDAGMSGHDAAGSGVPEPAAIPEPRDR
jgi:hypothetical protein